MTDVLATDYLTVMRADLVAILTQNLAIPYHDYEPKSLGDAPAAWFGRPAISYDEFDHAVVVTWPMSFAGHPVDPENTTHVGDVDVWTVWREFGAGRKVIIDGHRSVRALRADPASGVTIGDVTYPIYDIRIETTVPVGVC